MMLVIRDCTLPSTGTGLSLMGLAMLLVLTGAIVWRLPRAHRARVMLAIAVPLAALSMGVNRASADTELCPEDTIAATTTTTTATTTTVAATTTTVAATTTTVAATTTTVAPYGVTITFLSGGYGGPMTVSGSGWTPASVTTNNSDEQTQTITGQVSAANPTISINAPDSVAYREGSITGGSCTDASGAGLSTTGTFFATVAFPVSCTLTGDFSIQFSMGA